LSKSQQKKSKHNDSIQRKKKVRDGINKTTQTAKV